jgi:hypothetical protein
MWFLTVKIFLYIKWKIRKLERKVWSWMGGAQLEGSHSPWELRNGGIQSYRLLHTIIFPNTIHLTRK